MKMKENRKSLLGKKGGMTLLEIILVFALLALLTAAIVGKFAGVFDRAEIDATAIKVNDTLKMPLTRFRMDTGRYPTTEQGLAALLNKPSNDRGRWRGPYIEDDELIHDAWGEKLQYRSPGTNNPNSYDVYSFGKDGKQSDDDIGNWK